MPEIKIGSIVSLKSDIEGEIWMTVVEVFNDEPNWRANCAWFNKNNEVVECTIPILALTLINLPE